MKKILEWIKLMRPKHYLKNFLVLVPLFFDLKLFQETVLLRAVLGFTIFSFLSSMVYIVNDLHDRESDRYHEDKKNRPLASGAVSVLEACVLFCVLAAAVAVLNIPVQGKAFYLLVLYFMLNLLYSTKMKDVPLLDVIILVSGFLLRLLYGAQITGIAVSFWLYMTVMSASFYMGLGKRRNELLKNKVCPEKIRHVLKFYTDEFLDKNMYMCMGMAVMFYALWANAAETVEKIGSSYQVWTVPLVIVIAMKYSLDIESGEYADPIEVITKDKGMVGLGLIYMFVMFAILYIA